MFSTIPKEDRESSITEISGLDDTSGRWDSEGTSLYSSLRTPRSRQGRELSTSEGFGSYSICLTLLKL